MASPFSPSAGEPVERANPALNYIATDRIRVDPAFNPRKKFTDEETSAFAERISHSGWVSPLLVRPDPANPEGLLLVAGERRLRAVRHLGWKEVPAEVREMTDDEHRHLALAENVDRKELTVAEEAMAAREHIDAYGGDHALAARMLGWSESKLRHRLQLLHCAPEVMSALLEQQIDLGHAELFATLPPDRQLKALPRLLEAKLSVAEFREQVKGFSQPLDKAIFDKTQCQGCPANSDTQGNLFATNVGNGRCTNRDCFTVKTGEALQDRKRELAEEFSIVVFASEKVPDTTTALLRHGPNGVGDSQFEACRTCNFRGAIVNDAPGSSIGSVEGPNCFNLTCHREKRAALLQAERADPDTEGTPDSPGHAKSDASGTQAGSVSPSDKNAGGNAGPAKTATSGQGTAKAGPKEAPKSVQDAYAKIVARAASSRITASSPHALAVATFTLMRAICDEIDGLTFTALTKELGIPFKGDADPARRGNTSVVFELAKRSEADLMGLMQSLTIRLMESCGTDGSLRGKLNRRAIASEYATDPTIPMADHVVVDKDFLYAHTRPAIENILEESGFKAWMSAQEDGAKRYAALIGGGKATSIDAILSAGFDFKGYVPSGLNQQAKKWRSFK